uniref:Peptidase_M1 domain-containing protein n=1 Tax=Heligmosomoides polygyrus TaxID=6339 RepID=A0A8L8JU17_HELPZ
LKWWDDLWLNEGFATFMESIGTDEISDKHFRTKDYSLLSSLAAGLHEDEVASSHPLSFQIDKATEVLEAFDSISYDKGASVLAMLSAVIGEKTFKKAVTLGFPMVTAESLNETTVKITQKRYKINQKAEEQEKYRRPKHGFKWDIPLWYQQSSEGEVKLTWLTRGTALVIKLHGFYRQNYDAKGWSHIIRQLHEDHEVYSARTRNAIISDAFSAALIDELDYETLFKLLEYSRNEDEYLPWEETMNGLISILEFFGNEAESKLAKNYMRSIVKPIYDKANIENLTSHYKDEKHFFQMNLQQSAIDTFCKLDSRDCVAQQKAIFDRELVKKCEGGQMASECVSWGADSSDATFLFSVAAPLRSMVYCYGVKEGGDPAFNKVMELYKIERVQLEKDRLLLALGCHNDTAALKG